MTSPIELESTRLISLDNLRRYLLAAGWRRRQLKNTEAKPINRFEMYTLNEREKTRFQITLPLAVDASDTLLRIRDAVQAITEAELREPTHVIDSIQRIGYDVLRSAIPTSQVRDDTISLSSATEFVARMRGLLASAATTEKRPLPFYGRLLKESVQFADACRFGHTYRGSFGFVLESPLPALELAPALLESAVAPFERRVIQRFARGIAAVVLADANQSTKPLLDAIDFGFSANGCEQFADLIETVNPAGLTFSFDLSPEWAESRDMHASRYTVSAAHIEICRSAARELRRDDFMLPVNVAGRIVRLQNQTDPTDVTSRTGEHEILILWASLDFGDIQIRVNLTPADYLTAVAAHGSGKTVWVSGLLTKSGRQWFLVNPDRFSVPQQTEFDFEKI